MTNDSTQSEIKLSDGSDATVGKLTWRGYKAVKALLAETIAGPLLREATSIISGPLGAVLGDLLQGIAAAVKGGEEGEKAKSDLSAALIDKWGDAQAASLILKSLEQLKTSVSKMLTELLETSDEFTELLLINSCGIDSNRVAKLAVQDVVALRDAALNVNDLAELLEMEKNWWGRVMTTGKACLGTPRLNSPGMSTTSIN